MIFTIAGIVLIITGFVFIYRNYEFLGAASRTKGVIIDLSWKRDKEGWEMAYPVFQFIDEKTDQVFVVESTRGSKPPAYSVGQEVFILYDPENPHNARIESFLDMWLGAVLFTLLGSIFLLVGVMPHGLDIHRQKTIEYLKTRGQIIHGKASKIYQVTSYSEHGENPWCIVVRWLNQDSGKLHVFKSDHIWYNPSDFVKIGEEVEVRIDPKNPKKHWVNIDSFLRKKENPYY